MALGRLAFGLSVSSALSRSPRRLSASLRRRNRPFIAASAKKSVVFLGTPQVAAAALKKLAAASQTPSSTFSITSVVSQPPAPKGRKRILTKSPVHELADELHIPALTPASARDPAFLAQLRALAPDLCITAAYGQFLPADFLAVPAHGTLNIHPSLLPSFRGAAPVPRALEAGVDVTGVSILYTVLKMDAGPIVARRERRLMGHEQAPELLDELFETGVEALLDAMPSVWDEAVDKQEQKEQEATHAPKLSKDEARLTFTENANIVHNKVRAFAGWPGTWADFIVGVTDVMRLKVVKTHVLRAEGGMCLGVHDVSYDEENDCLAVVCDDGSKIGISEIQPQGKKVMNARSFWNGLRGKNVERKRVPH